jgi:hypothetical protein
MAARNHDTPSIREIAELTARLRRLSAAGRAADPAERAAFLADKDALTARIQTATRTAAVPVQDEYTGTGYAGAGAAVMALAAAGGYAMVGPSARTWSVDPATGIPAGPVPEAEHRLVRDMIARERLDGAEPVWLRCTDGRDEIVAAVVPARPDADADAVTVADELPAAAAAETGQDTADGRPTAATSVAQAHEAITPLGEPAANQQQTTDDTRAAELAGWGRHEQPADAAAADDGQGWSR